MNTLKIERQLEEKFSDILDILGFDLTLPNLKDTPKRWAHMMLFDICGAMWDKSELDKITVFPNREQYNQLIVFSDISFYSVCSHHFLPFFGKAYVAYLPDAKYVGLSKVVRIIKYFAKKPQVQEEMTQEIANFLFDVLDAFGVMVVLQGQHLCMQMRGIKEPGVVVTTSAIRGENFPKEEAMNLFLHKNGE